MSLFENFPYTNLHELNLDWLIQEMKDLEEKVQDGPVVSVNGQTGVVTLYQEAQIQLPDITDSQQTFWNIFRYLNGHIYGIRFDSNGNVYAIRDGINTKLLTWADIPADAGVISVNGLYGVVHISGTDIPWMGGENETIFDKLSDNEDAIDELTITLGTLSNAIKAGIAYLEQNVGDTAIHNIPAGSYVFWKNYAYKSTQAISIGDTLSSTNLQAVGDGGFINALQAEIDKLNSNIQTVTITGNTTIAALKTNLLNTANAAGNTPVRIKFYSALTDSGFVNGQRYYGTLCVQEVSGGTVTHFTVLFNSDKGETVSVGYDSGTWSIEKIAVSSEFNYLNKYCKQVIIPANGSASIPFNQYNIAIIIGLAQGQGQICLIANGTNSGATIKNLFDGSTYTGSTLSISRNQGSNELVFTNNYSHETDLFVISTGH